MVMNNSIEVWRPRIAVPLAIKQRIAKYEKSTSSSRLRDGQGVDPTSIYRMNALYTDGICSWHDDVGLDNQYSLIFVLRNDIGSWVESKGVKPIKDQPVGTMIFLDIWKKHRLWHHRGSKAPIGVYLALCLDLENPPKTKKECERLMRNKIETSIL
jgi:hypothetical protein